MLRAGTGLCSHPEPREAARGACRRALAGLASGVGPGALPGAGPGTGAPRPSGALLLASGGHAEAAPTLLATASELLGTELIAGASVDGLWAPEQAWARGRLGAAHREGGPAPGHEEPADAAVGVVILAGASVEPFLLRDLEGCEGRGGAELARWLAGRGGPPRAGDLVLLLPDADALALGPLAAGLAEPLAPAAVAGVGAAEGPGGTPLGWCGREVASGALAGLVVRGGPPARLAVAGAFRPVTEPLKVTRARGHWILGLDGRPALDVFREVAREPLAWDLRRAAEHVLVALPRSSGRLDRGELVVRRVAGFDPRRRAFAVPFRVGAAVETGSGASARRGSGGRDPRGADELALAVRDPDWARTELKAHLAELASGAGPASGAPPALALWLSCSVRSESLLGPPGLEAGYVEAALGRAPLLGVLGPAQIGPVAGRPEALVHSGVGVALGP